MKPRPGPASEVESASRQIDAMVKGQCDWRGSTLSQLRTLIKKADPDIIEEVKWKKPSNPAGVPVWSHGGMVCVGNVLKSAVRLTFPEGTRIRGPKKLFNARLDSKTVRAIDFHEGDLIDQSALKALVLEAVELNTQKAKSR